MEQKVVIVTGASRGIGKEIAKTLAKKGYKVVGTYNNSQKEIEEIKEQIDIVQANLSQREDAKKVIEYTLNKYNKIDVLINNAGISQIKEFTQITDEEWKKMLDVNLNSVFYMTQESLKNMIHNKNGCIINISSIWGQIGASCEAHYSVSKAGIDAITKSLAKELGPSNIRINSISPGIINTNMNKNLNNDEIQEIINEIPLERIGKPSDIAKCVEWLIEDNYTTGQVISINGGWNI